MYVVRVEGNTKHLLAAESLPALRTVECQGENYMPRQANYEIVEDRHASGGPLVIRDLGPWDRHPSVTNAAEEVVVRLVESGELHGGQRLFYYDSEGDLDEIVVRAGQFAGFRTGSTGGSHDS